MNDSIERYLQVLHELPLWAVGRAGSVDWFQFGSHHAVPSRRGEIKDAGDYALHLSCRWELRRSQFGSVTASSESSRADLASVGALGLICSEARMDSDLALCLMFTSGHLLRTESDEDDAEFWRLFSPGKKYPHLVVDSAGARIDA